MKFNTLEFIKRLVRFQTVSADPSKRSEIEACADFLKREFSAMGFDVEISRNGLSPIVLAKRDSRGPGKAKYRILCYGHYDVQPADPLDEWKTDPFEAVERDGKLWGRGTADNKGPSACMIAGLLNFLEKNPDAPLDVAVILEGEEEIGSASMSAFVKDRAEFISSYDFAVLSDTSAASENQIVVTTGLRGTGSLEAIFTGCNTDVHSGMFGGAVYNPIQAMSEVCASLHNGDGFVNIKGFYDNIPPLSEWERSEIASHPMGEAQIMNQLEIPAMYKQKGYKPAEALRALPALDFTGIGGGYQGEGPKSVIPSKCFCKISIRTVPPQDTRKMIELVKGAIRERCPKQIKVEFKEYEGCGNGYFLDAKNPGSDLSPHKREALERAFSAMEKCVAEVFGKKPLFLREGASIPLISDIKREAGIDCLMIGFFTPRDNLHAPNEGFPLQMIGRASIYYERFFEEMTK